MRAWTGCPATLPAKGEFLQPPFASSVPTHHEQACIANLDCTEACCSLKL